jgi:hypothetical protein
MSTDVLEKPDLKETDQGEEHFAHYTDAASATEGYIMGTPITALCGKVFVPHRDPEKLRVCPKCREILESLNSYNAE